MTDLLSVILAHLDALVGFDTQNPPRSLDAQSPLFAYLTKALPGFDAEIADLGDGSVNYLACRGEPTTLFNVHLDTVPATDAWSSNPFELVRSADRCIGLGACDIKGAAATLLALAAGTDAPMALLFTTDEEAGQGRCIKSFLECGTTYERVIVAEPTGSQAVTQHRGIASIALQFEGAGAHASTPLKRKNNAVHKAAMWASSAIDYANDNPQGDDFRLNIGVMSGGVKPNVSAPHCEVRFGLRPPPGVPSKGAVEAFTSFGDIAGCEVTFAGAALPASEGEGAQGRLLQIEAFARDVGIPLGAPVDFWTEAALFGAAGWPALVLGPGHISEAHSAGEWVAYEQLIAAYEAYGRILGHGQ